MTRYSASDVARQEYEPRFFEGREMEKPMNAEPNQFPWGSHLVKTTIFFDNVFRIPPSNQRGKFCIACRTQATFVKLDEDGDCWSSIATIMFSKRVGDTCRSAVVWKVFQHSF